MTQVHMKNFANSSDSAPPATSLTAYILKAVVTADIRVINGAICPFPLESRSHRSISPTSTSQVN